MPPSTTTFGQFGTNLNQILTALNLAMQDYTHDQNGVQVAAGNCFYEALSVALGETVTQQATNGKRALLVQYIQNNRSTYDPIFVQNNLNADSELASWGNNCQVLDHDISCRAATEIWNINIRVIYNSIGTTNIGLVEEYWYQDLDPAQQQLILGSAMQEVTLVFNTTLATGLAHYIAALPQANFEQGTKAKATAGNKTKATSGTTGTTGSKTNGSKTNGSKTKQSSKELIKQPWSTLTEQNSAESKAKSVQHSMEQLPSWLTAAAGYGGTIVDHTAPIPVPPGLRSLNYPLVLESPESFSAEDVELFTLWLNRLEGAREIVRSHPHMTRVLNGVARLQEVRNTNNILVVGLGRILAEDYIPSVPMIQLAATIEVMTMIADTKLTKPATQEQGKLTLAQSLPALTFHDPTFTPQEILFLSALPNSIVSNSTTLPDMPFDQQTLVALYNLSHKQQVFQYILPNKGNSIAWIMYSVPLRMSERDTTHGGQGLFTKIGLSLQALIDYGDWENYGFPRDLEIPGARTIENEALCDHVLYIPRE